MCRACGCRDWWFDDSEPYCTMMGVGAGALAAVTMGGMVAMVLLMPPAYLTSLQFFGAAALWLCLMAALWVALCNNLRCDFHEPAWIIAAPDLAVTGRPQPPIYVLQVDDDDN